MRTHRLGARTTIPHRAYTNSYHAEPVVVGKIPRSELGQCINVVEHPPYPCPECAYGGPLQVFAKAVLWPCGHTRSLPTLNISGDHTRRHQLAA